MGWRELCPESILPLEFRRHIKQTWQDLEVEACFDLTSRVETSGSVSKPAWHVCAYRERVILCTPRLACAWGSSQIFLELSIEFAV